MIPEVLFQLTVPGGRTLFFSTYAVMRALGVTALLIAWQAGFRRRGLDPDHGFMAAVWVLPIAWLAAAGVAVGEALSRAVTTGAAPIPLVLAALGSFGGTVLAAIPAGILAMVFYARFYELRVATCLDVAALGAAAFIPFQRIGCLGAGCCFGTPTSVPWAIRRAAAPPEYLALSGIEIPVHPTQAYEGGATALLLVVLLWLSRRKTVPGVVGWTFVGGYSAIRFVVGIFRGDAPRFFFSNTLGVEHVLYAAGMTVAGVMLARLYRRAEA